MNFFKKIEIIKILDTVIRTKWKKIFLWINANYTLTNISFPWERAFGFPKPKIGIPPLYVWIKGVGFRTTLFLIGVLFWSKFGDVCGKANVMSFPKWSWKVLPPGTTGGSCTGDGLSTGSSGISSCCRSLLSGYWIVGSLIILTLEAKSKKAMIV